MSEALEIRIDLSGPEAVFRQIASQIRALLLDGRLKVGDALPGVRRLSTDLGVHFNTVAEAYRQLAAEGWLDVSHGRAVRVLERPMPKPDAAQAEVYRERLRRLVGEMRADGFRLNRIRKEIQDVLEEMEA